MAITDLAAYQARLASPRERPALWKGTITTVTGRWSSSWTLNPEAGAAPTTAATCTVDTKGALGTIVASAPQILDGNAERLLMAQVMAFGPVRGGVLMLVDRLSHQGGLSGIVTTPGTTTNLPTAALPRYTTGAGVMAALEIYTVIGTTGTTFTVTYTNQAGTGSKVSPLTDVGATGRREAQKLLFIPLAAGDSGVRSIESYTLTATTGTAGAFGFTLFKPLALLPLSGSEQGIDELLFLIANMPAIDPQACLSLWLLHPSTGGAVLADFVLAED